MTAERDSMALNEISYPALGVEERSDEAPRAGRPKPAECNPLDSKVRTLDAKVARPEHELHTAHTILDVQGKVAGLLGSNLERATRS